MAKALQSRTEIIIQGVTGSKEKVQETFLSSVLYNEGRCWTEFYKYVKRRKGDRKNILVIKDNNAKLITDPKEKANSLNSYYGSQFGCKCNNPQIKSTESGIPFTISTNIIRKWLSAIGRKTSVGPVGIPGEILK